MAWTLFDRRSGANGCRIGLPGWALLAGMGLSACASAPTSGFGGESTGLTGAAAASPPACPAPAKLPDAVGQLRLWLLTAGHEWVAVQAKAPSVALERRPIAGLPAGDEILGLDYRVARGELYALSREGQLWRADPASGVLSPVGQGLGLALRGQSFDIDFNPTVDRLRVVSDAGQNLRVHPDTGQVLAQDPDLHTLEKRLLAVSATAYTYHPTDDKLTTNFVIDRLSGQWMLQGSREGETPVVSPNTGRLTAVGSLGLGPDLSHASLDISDRGHVALAALGHGGRTRLHWIDLASGQARCLGLLLDGQAIRGIAIEP